jgi:hypothetical protein
MLSLAVLRLQAREAVSAQPKDWQLVLLGTGDVHLQRELQYIERAMPGRAKGIVNFQERLAHRLMAAADILVVPSRFEPCGIVALAALRYGAVPVVASTGGLRDIVTGRFLVVTDDKDMPQVCPASMPWLHIAFQIIYRGDKVTPRQFRASLSSKMCRAHLWACVPGNPRYYGR